MSQELSNVTEDTAAAGPLATPAIPEEAPVRLRRKPRAKPGSLKAWRSARGINQRVAANALGISQTYYSKLEVGTHFPGRKLGKRLSVLTGLPVEVVLGLRS